MSAQTLEQYTAWPGEQGGTPAFRIAGRVLALPDWWATHPSWARGTTAALRISQTPAHANVSLSPVAAPLGKAVVAYDDTHVVFDARMLDAIWASRLSREEGPSACGMVKIGFPLDSSDYDDRPDDD